MITTNSVYEAPLKARRLVCALHKVLKLISIITIMLVVVSCEQSTELQEPIPPRPPYKSFQIGNMWQIYNTAEGIYWQEEVADTIRRSDGVKTFIIKISEVINGLLFTGSINEFIRGNYVIQTNLDTSAVYPGNKYEEIRIAEIFPIDGDYFLQNEGASDSDKDYFRTELIDSLQTPCGTFWNVAKYSVDNKYFPYGLIIYYASGYGYIGNTVYDKERKQHDLFITYIKINGKELGKFNPLHDGIGIIQQATIKKFSNPLSHIYDILSRNQIFK